MTGRGEEGKGERRGRERGILLPLSRRPNLTSDRLRPMVGKRKEEEEI